MLIAELWLIAKTYNMKNQKDPSQHLTADKNTANQDCDLSSKYRVLKVDIRLEIFIGSH